MARLPAGWTPRHKFDAKPQIVDDYWFASTREANRYKELVWLEGRGQVAFHLRQVRIPIIPPTRAMVDGKLKVVDKGVVFVVDFIVFWTDGQVTFEDTKGHRTEEYLRKKRQVEARYPIKIVEL